MCICLILLMDVRHKVDLYSCRMLQRNQHIYLAQLYHQYMSQYSNLHHPIDKLDCYIRRNYHIVHCQVILHYSQCRLLGLCNDMMCVRNLLLCMLARNNNKIVRLDDYIDVNVDDWQADDALEFRYIFCLAPFGTCKQSNFQ